MARVCLRDIDIVKVNHYYRLRLLHCWEYSRNLWNCSLLLVEYFDIQNSNELMSLKNFKFSINFHSFLRIQFRNPFNSRIIVWEIEKSKESSWWSLSVCLLLWSVAMLWAKRNFSNFHFHPRKNLAIISNSKILLPSAYFHILFCIFSNLQSRLSSHLKDPRFCLWDGCKYFLKHRASFFSLIFLFSCILNIVEKISDFPSFSVGKKLLIFVIQIYDFVHSQSCEEVAVVVVWWVNESRTSCLFNVQRYCTFDTFSQLTIDWFSSIYHWHYHHHIDAIKSIQGSLIKHFRTNFWLFIIFIGILLKSGWWTEECLIKYYCAILFYIPYSAHIATSNFNIWEFVCLLHCSSCLQLIDSRIHFPLHSALLHKLHPKNQLFERKHC